MPANADWSLYFLRHARRRRARPDHRCGDENDLRRVRSLWLSACWPMLSMSCGTAACDNRHQTSDQNADGQCEVGKAQADARAEVFREQTDDNSSTSSSSVPTP